MSSNNVNLAMQRIAKLVDENSFMEIGSLVTARSTDFNLTAAKTPSDGVIIGHGLIDGNLVFIYSQDASVLNGTIGEMHAKKIASVYDMAMKMGAPVIGFIDCGGIRLQESVDALDGFGTIYAKEVAASGVVPQICGVFGNCGGGLSVVPALCDFAFIEESKGRMFVNTPDAIEGNRTEKCDTASAAFQSENNGCVDFVGSEDEIMYQIRQLVTMLPSNSEGDVYTDTCEDDLNRACQSMDSMKGDPRYLLSQISDNNIFFESKPDYAKNMVTGLIKLNGMTVGAVANCSEVYDAEGKKTETFDKALTARGCNKAADFIQFCDAFFDSGALHYQCERFQELHVFGEESCQGSGADDLCVFQCDLCQGESDYRGSIRKCLCIYEFQVHRGRSGIRMERCKDRYDGCNTGSKDHVSGCRSR